MVDFKSIEKIAEKRKGGAKQLAKWLPRQATAKKIAKIDDSRFLSEMTKCIFQAGFVWRD